MAHSTTNAASTTNIQSSYQSLPIELRQQILHLTISPCLSWDPVFWSDAEVSQERFIVSWASTLRLVSKGVRDEVGWVEKQWVEHLRREREDRYRVWWGNLGKVMMGEVK
jgi:hypothetical protein